MPFLKASNLICDLRTLNDFFYYKPMWSTLGSLLSNTIEMQAQELREFTRKDHQTNITAHRIRTRIVEGFMRIMRGWNV